MTLTYTVVPSRPWNDLPVLVNSQVVAPLPHCPERCRSLTTALEREGPLVEAGFEVHSDCMGIAAHSEADGWASHDTELGHIDDTLPHLGRPDCQPEAYCMVAVEAEAAERMRTTPFGGYTPGL